MKEIIKVFKSKRMRCILINGEPYFNAQDTCFLLGLKNTSRALKSIKKDDITTSNVIDSLGRNQEVYFLSEQGLYDLIFKSKKQEARDFQQWVTHEVLPSIRKTGQYSIPNEIKKLSTQKRTELTTEWQNHGIKEPYEYIQLTLAEYKSLGFEKDKRKKDLSRGELLLSALESMEALKLFNNENINGYYECKDSLIETSKKIPYNKLNEIEVNK